VVSAIIKRPAPATSAAAGPEWNAMFSPLFNSMMATAGAKKHRAGLARGRSCPFRGGQQ